jgi:nicotinamide-nucleotide amidase
MPNASIIAVGTELLFGQIVNTNAAYLSEQLQLLGHNVLYHYTVGDNPERMRETLDLALKDADIVLTSGGLGPTQDDLTKEIIAERMGARLALDERALDEIATFFARIGRGMTDNNRKQAMLPEGATVFYNEVGTAPGFALEKGGKTVIALPGPPSELRRMFERSAMPFLEGRSDAVIYHKLLRFFGIGESQLETDLAPLIDGQTDPTIATYASTGECSLRIASKRPTREEARAAVEETEKAVLAIVGKYMYSDRGEELCEVVAKKLLEKGLTLSSAESCTGGLFASTLLSHPGISAAYDRGFITYGNESKTAELGVAPELIERCGAVSPEVAAAMAEGARAAAGTDIGISVTGVAGPDGGTAEKPVGLAYIAVADAAGSIVKEHKSRDHGRDYNRKVATLAMFGILHRHLFRF